MFELLQAGKVPVSAELIAERSGVSVASVFRYFDGLDDIVYHTLVRFRERFAPLLAVSEEILATPREARVAAFVDARLELYQQAGTIMAVGRLRAFEHEQFVVAASEMRALLADQVGSVFGADTAGASQPRAAELVALLDGLTSLDAWDVMHRTHGLTNTQIAHSWTRAVTALVEAWQHSPTDDRGASR